MNIGVVIGIVLVCLGVIIFCGMWFDFIPTSKIAFYGSVAAVVGGFFVILFASAYVPYNPDSGKDKEYEHVCAICGKEAIFAESVINSKSNDWFCQKHWQDVKKHYGINANEKNQ